MFDSIDLAILMRNIGQEVKKQISEESELVWKHLLQISTKKKAHQKEDILRRVKRPPLINNIYTGLPRGLGHWLMSSLYQESVKFQNDHCKIRMRDQRRICGYMCWAVGGGGGQRRRSQIVVYYPHIKEDDRSDFYVDFLEMQFKVCIQGFSTKFNRGIYNVITILACRTPGKSS